MRLLRNGVVTRAAPWMASANALDAQPTALEDSVFQHRLHHVLRAGGGEAAGWGSVWGDAVLIEQYWQTQEPCESL